MSGVKESKKLPVIDILGPESTRTSSHVELENVKILEQLKNDVLLPVKPDFYKEFD